MLARATAIYSRARSATANDWPYCSRPRQVPSSRSTSSAVRQGVVMRCNPWLCRGQPCRPLVPWEKVGARTGERFPFKRNSGMIGCAWREQDAEAFRFGFEGDAPVSRGLMPEMALPAAQVERLIG